MCRRSDFANVLAYTTCGLNGTISAPTTGKWQRRNRSGCSSTGTVKVRPGPEDCRRLSNMKSASPGRRRKPMTQKADHGQDDFRNRRYRGSVPESRHLAVHLGGEVSRCGSRRRTRCRNVPARIDLVGGRGAARRGLTWRAGGCKPAGPSNSEYPGTYVPRPASSREYHDPT